MPCSTSSKWRRDLNQMASVEAGRFTSRLQYTRLSRGGCAFVNLACQLVDFPYDTIVSRRLGSSTPTR